MEKKAKEKLWNGKFIFLIVISCITGFGFNMVYTMVVDYSVTHLSATLSVAGLISGIFSIAALMMRPFAGAASDFYNKKKICIISTGVIALTALGYAFAPNIPCMFAVRILHGAAFGVSSTVNIALVSFCIPHDRMAEGLGYYGLGQILASAVGPGMGAAIQEKYGYETLFLIIFALTAVATIGLCFFRYQEPAKEKKPDSFAAMLSPKRIIATDVLMYAVIGSLFSFSNGVVNAFLKTFCESRNIPNYAVFFTVSAIVLFGMRLSIGKIADKKGITGIVNFSLIASFAAMVLLGKSTSLAMLLVAAALKAAGQGGGQVSLQAECIKKAGPERSGVAAGTFYIGADIGQGIGPAISGVIAASFGCEAAFFFTGVLLLAGCVLFNYYQKKQKDIAVENIEASPLSPEGGDTDA
jgi:predicted MFS family arabinose efflux permease